MNKLLALVGRTNVGKSTLFNRLSDKKKAIIHDYPGVTRDRQYSEASLAGLKFTLVDTPGLEQASKGELEAGMLIQLQAALKEADLIALVVDGRLGVSPEDRYLAQQIKKLGKNHIVIVNKCEKRFDFDGSYYKLGASPIPISAEHNIGLADLYEALAEYFSDENFVNEHNKSKDVIKITIAGRPNAGKSTLINNILKEDRLLTSPIAGTTRDSIDIDFTFQNQKFSLIDTAGLRKKAHIIESLEKLSVSNTMHNINYAHLVILMLDATRVLEHQDLNIASYVIEEGRGLLIIVNKWDLVEKKKEFLELFEYRLSKSLSLLKDPKVLFISALHDKNLEHIFKECLILYKNWNTKISTSKLNDWLRIASDNHNLPLASFGRRVKLKYITQTSIRPPTFKIFCNNLSKIDDNYQRYLMNHMRNYFNILSVPLRLNFTKSANPYSSK